MKKDEIIQLLKEQLDRATENNNQLLQRIDALLERIASLEEALLQKGESLEKQKRVNKGLTKIIMFLCNKLNIIENYEQHILHCRKPFRFAS